jgi:hemerythrin
MAFINWDEKYRIGIPLIDDEHREQMLVLSMLHDEYKRSADVVKLHHLFDELISCTRQHFKDEERLMREQSFPLLEDHARSHRELIEKVENIKSEIESGKITFSFELILFFKDWLMLHIIGSDMKYRDFIVGKGRI